MIQAPILNEHRSLAGPVYVEGVLDAARLARRRQVNLQALGRGRLALRAERALIVQGQGVQAVPQTTRRAGRSLGLTYWQDVREIVFPIALRVALPSWTGLTLGVMKDSALVMWIGIAELLRTSQVIITRIQEPLLVLSVCGLIYFLMSYPISRLGARLETKWRDLD